MTKPIVRKQRCAIYTRKSSEEGLEQEFNSLHAQREACEAFVASQRSEGWVPVRDQYDDGGISGGTLDRPGLQRLLEDIEDGLVDVVVVYKIDRLSRSLADFAKLVEVFDRNGVTFVSVMREAGGQLKTDWRRQISGAGLGQRLARSIRAETWPKGTTSIGAASLVWSKAPAIVGAHDTGPLIRSKDGFWLAIPTEAAGRGLRGGRITPGEWERRRGLRLRFVYRRRGPSLLVADRARINKRGQAVASRAKTGRNQVTAPIFLLVPQVKLPKRLDLDRDAERAHDSVPGLIVANWVEGRI